MVVRIGGGKVGVAIPDTDLGKDGSAAKKADRKAYNFHIIIGFLQPETDRKKNTGFPRGNPVDIIHLFL